MCIFLLGSILVSILAFVKLQCGFYVGFMWVLFFGSIRVRLWVLFGFCFVFIWVVLGLDLGSACVLFGFYVGFFRFLFWVLFGVYLGFIWHLFRVLLWFDLESMLGSSCFCCLLRGFDDGLYSGSILGFYVGSIWT